MPNTPAQDTYDVILGRDGYLYVSDGTSGLRVLRYTGRTDATMPVTMNATCTLSARTVESSCLHLARVTTIANE